MTPGSSAFDIELVWLDTTLEPYAIQVAPPPKRSFSPIVIAVAVLVLLAAGGWWINGALRPTTAELMQTGWQAYHHGDYEASAIALAAAEAQTPDSPDIPDLKIAIEVAPTLDAIEVDVDAGDVEKAHARIRGALAQAPNDRRAVRLAIRLRTIQANAALAGTTPKPSPFAPVTTTRLKSARSPN